jgi:hypothetical protein
LPAAERAYPVVDTGQTGTYDDMGSIPAPTAGADWYGQDSQFDGPQPSYTNNDDGTVTDNVTGLMWTQSPDLNGDGIIDSNDKLLLSAALTRADTITVGGYDDWRVPTIKELYSLMHFAGTDVSAYAEDDTSVLTPFLDPTAFAFGYGDVAAGERLIDVQFATTSIYMDTVMDGQEGMFGVNFADGRIKGYPTASKTLYVLFVRGRTSYGINDFADNRDGTVTDHATGLMWSQNDSVSALNWKETLAWVATKNSENHLGHSDWRLPNMKELHSILDYSRSPATDGTAAIDPVFTCSAITAEDGSADWPFYWSGTTHLGYSPNGVNARYATYSAFGRALGWMQFRSDTSLKLYDVHGAGAQRSDPKSGDPADFPTGHGPQGDVIRIYNHVRLVRDDSNSGTRVITLNVAEDGGSSPSLTVNLDNGAGDLITASGGARFSGLQTGDDVSASFSEGLPEAIGWQTSRNPGERLATAP